MLSLGLPLVQILAVSMPPNVDEDLSKHLDEFEGQNDGHSEVEGQGSAKGSKERVSL